jgi:hypothetical protein
LERGEVAVFQPDVAKARGLKIDAGFSRKLVRWTKKGLALQGSFRYSFDLLPDGRITPTALKGK